MRSNPRSLQLEAEARAQAALDTRLAEIRAMAPLLQHLQALLPCLEQHGLHICTDALELRQHRLPDTAGLCKVLRVKTDAYTSGHTPKRWLDALLALGLKLVMVQPSQYYPTALLRKGPLLMCIDITQEAALALCANPATAQGSA